MALELISQALGISIWTPRFNTWVSLMISCWRPAVSSMRSIPLITASTGCYRGGGGYNACIKYCGRGTGRSIQLKAQLDRELAECTEVKPGYRNKVKAFMVERGIWHISDWIILTGNLPEIFGRTNLFLAISTYINALTRLRQHSIWNQPRKIRGKRLKLKYENLLLFLLYHPDQTIVNRLKSTEENRALWDFSGCAGKHEAAGIPGSKLFNRHSPNW